MEEATRKADKLATEVLILNQSAGTMVYEVADCLIKNGASVALLTGGLEGFDGGFGTNSRLEVTTGPRLRRGSIRERFVSWLHFAIVAGMWSLRRSRNSCLIIYSNPPVLLWLGFLARKLRGQQYIIVVFDVYPDILVRLGKIRPDGIIQRIWNWANRRAFVAASAVVTLSERMRAAVLAQCHHHDGPLADVKIIRAWLDLQRFRPRSKADNSFAASFGQRDKLTVMYSGNMGSSHDLETMLAAAQRLSANRDIHFFFIGGGEKWSAIHQTVTSAEMHNVTVLPWQSGEDFCMSQAAADVAVVSMDVAGDGVMFPSKVVAAMACGCALISIGVEDNDVQRLIEKEGCGSNVEPGDVEAFTMAVLAYRDSPILLKTHRKCARQAAERLFARDVNAPILAEVVNRVANNRT